MGWIAAKWAATAIFRKKAGDAVSHVPWQVWAVLGGAVLLLLFILWHGHAISNVKSEAFKAGYARAVADDAAEAAKLRGQLKLANDKIALSERKKNDAAVRDISSTADALSMHGPGKARASCPRLPAAPSGPQPATEQAGPAAAGLPPEDGAGELAAVSWRWLVGTGKQCDIERAEVISWRNWYQQLHQIWPQENSQVPDAK